MKTVFSKTVTKRSSIHIKNDGRHQISQASQVSLRYTEKTLFGRAKRVYELSSDGGHTWSEISKMEYDELLDEGHTDKPLLHK